MTCTPPSPQPPQFSSHLYVLCMQYGTCFENSEHYQLLSVPEREIQRTVHSEGQNQDDTLSIMSESYSPFPSHLILFEHNNKKLEESQALSTGKAKFGTAEALAADKAYEATNTLRYPWQQTKHMKRSIL